MILDDSVRFYEYDGDLIGLTTNENHVNFRWTEPGCKVLFSAARMGKGMSCHFASDKRGLLKLKRAINDFCEFVFEFDPECKMVFANTLKESVGDLIIGCNFKKLCCHGNGTVYMRGR